MDFALVGKDMALGYAGRDMLGGGYGVKEAGEEWA